MNTTDMVWIATRRKALLTAQELTTLAHIRGALTSPSGNSDPHLLAAIDELLAP